MDGLQARERQTQFAQGLRCAEVAAAFGTGEASESGSKLRALQTLARRRGMAVGGTISSKRACDLPLAIDLAKAYLGVGHVGHHLDFQGDGAVAGGLFPLQDAHAHEGG
jgi:hypothetical protein